MTLKERKEGFGRRKGKREMMNYNLKNKENDKSSLLLQQMETIVDFIFDYVYRYIDYTIHFPYFLWNATHNSLSYFGCSTQQML